MKFIQVPKDHKFEVGQTIRLGGRVGKIIKNSGTCQMAHEDHFVMTWDVLWSNGFMDYHVDLANFPSLEIAIPQPTISREAYEELERWYSEKELCGDVEDLMNKLRSMLQDKTRGEEKV